MGLAQLKTTVENAVNDLATLEVATFTNNAKTNLDLAKAVPQGKSEFSSSKLFELIRKSMVNADLVGYSKFEVEGDTINFLNSELGEGKKYLTENHNTLVEGAQRTRKDFFEFVVKTIKDI